MLAEPKAEIGVPVVRRRDLFNKPRRPRFNLDHAFILKRFADPCSRSEAVKLQEVRVSSIKLTDGAGIDVELAKVLIQLTIRLCGLYSVRVGLQGSGLVVGDIQLATVVLTKYIQKANKRVPRKFKPHLILYLEYLPGRERQCFEILPSLLQIVQIDFAGWGLDRKSVV